MRDRERALRKLAEACFRFSPQIALRENEAICLEIGGSRRIFTESSLRARLQAILLRFECRARVVFADDVCEAIALARYGCSSSGELPLKALYEYASPFSNDPETGKRVQFAMKQLERLGIKSLEEFRKLPLETLASRFGKEVSEAARWLSEGRDPAWPGFRPLEEIEEEADLCDCETRSACADVESMVFPLKSLLDRVTARLHARGERLMALELELKLEDRSTRSWELRFSSPQGATLAILTILQDRLRFELGTRLLARPVTQIRVRVLEAVPGRGAQRDFFCRRDEQKDSWDALFGRLSQKLGTDRVFVAAPVGRHLPEGAWSREGRFVVELESLPEGSGVRSGASPAHPGRPIRLTRSMYPDRPVLPDRPARVLKSPVPLNQVQRFLIQRSARLGTWTWEVVEWVGPERISGEWWSEGFDRDYYRVVTSSGEQLWVFAADDSLYLHGFFD